MLIHYLLWTIFRYSNIWNVLFSCLARFGRSFNNEALQDSVLLRMLIECCSIPNQILKHFNVGKRAILILPNEQFGWLPPSIIGWPGTYFYQDDGSRNVGHQNLPNEPTAHRILKHVNVQKKTNVESAEWADWAASAIPDGCLLVVVDFNGCLTHLRHISIRMIVSEI